MDSLISRQAAIDALCSECQGRCIPCKYYPCSEVKAINALPSAQPELIRCRDCKFWQDQEEGVIEVPICARPENKYEKLPFRLFIGEDGFCSFAERRTDGNCRD